jgi:hypothetical protein
MQRRIGACRRAQAADHAETRALRQLQVHDREADRVPVARLERFVLGRRRGHDLDPVRHRHELHEPLGDLGRVFHHEARS